MLQSDLGTHPARAAKRANLVELRPRAFLAATQPVDLWTALEGVKSTARDRTWMVLGEGALWLYGEVERPKTVTLGVPLHHKLKVSAPLATRRVVDRLFLGKRSRKGVPVPALEVAVVQYAAEHGDDTTRALIEKLVRDRKTTLVRLRARCYRGFKGSARVRRLCDELAGGSMDADVRRLVAALEARGVTGLRVEVRFEGDHGELAYGDIHHEETNTLVEVDGFLTHAQREQFKRDRKRDRWMRRVHKATTLREGPRDPRGPRRDGGRDRILPAADAGPGQRLLIFAPFAAPAGRFAGKDRQGVGRGRASGAEPS